MFFTRSEKTENIIKTISDATYFKRSRLLVLCKVPGRCLINDSNILAGLFPISTSELMTGREKVFTRLKRLSYIEQFYSYVISTCELYLHQLKQKIYNLNNFIRQKSKTLDSWLPRGFSVCTSRRLCNTLVKCLYRCICLSKNIENFQQACLYTIRLVQNAKLQCYTRVPTDSYIKWWAHCRDLLNQGNIARRMPFKWNTRKFSYRKRKHDHS